MATTKRSNWFTRQLRSLLDKEELKIANGYVMRCPWCEQNMLMYYETKSRLFMPYPYVDEYTCGHCGGSSMWAFEMMSHYLCQGDKPPERKSSFTEPETMRDIVYKAIEERALNVDRAEHKPV